MLKIKRRAISVFLLVCLLAFTGMQPGLAQGYNGSYSKYGSNKNEAMTFDFYNAADTYEGWTAGPNGSCTLSISNHKLVVNVTAADPQIYSENNINLNASVYKYIRIRMKNYNPGSSAGFYFITTTDQTWDTNKYVSISTRANDLTYYDYVVDLSSKAQWTGTIKQIRIDPVETVTSATVYIEYIKIETENLYPPSLYYPFEYDTNEWGLDYQYNCTLSATRGVMTVTNTGIDPQFMSPDWLLIDPTQIKYFRVKMRNNTSATICKIYWITTSDTTWNETKAKWVTINANDPEFTEYLIDLSGTASWTNGGSIKRIRFDPEEGVSSGTEEVKYIMLDSVNPSPVTYDFTSGTDGWTAANQCTISASEGILTVTNTGADPYILSPDNLNINADQLKYIKIKMKNNTYSNMGQLFWITTDDLTYNEQKSQIFTINEMESGYTVYTIGLNQNQYWKGSIKRIRLDPSNSSPSGTSQIDSIAVVTDGDTSAQNQQVREGLLDDTWSWLNGWSLDQSGGSIQGYMDSGNNSYDIITETGFNKYYNYSGGFKLTDSSNTAKTSISKKIPAQKKGLLEWDFMFEMDSPAVNGTEWKLMDGSTRIIGFNMANGGYFSSYPANTFSSINAYQWYTVKVIVDLDNNYYNVWVNGTASGPTNIAFENTPTKIDNIYIGTPVNGQVKFYGGNRIYRIGYMYTDFTMDGVNAAPVGLTLSGTGGSTLVQNMSAKSGIDNKLVMADNSASANLTISKTFSAARGLIEFQMDFLLQTKQDEVSFKLKSGSTDAVEFLTNGGNLCYRDSAGAVQNLWTNYKANVWYNMIVVVDIMEGAAKYYVNGQAKTAYVGLRNAVSTIDSYTASTSVGNQGNLAIRKIRLAPYILSTVPYVDKVSSTTGYIGVEAWFLSQDSFWNRVGNEYPVSDKTPYLGYYDNYNLEAVDWQVKWMAEYGIDFVSPFFYGPVDVPTYNGPDKLDETFILHSAKTDKLKFALTWHAMGGADYTHDNIINNVVPYWIEMYFKHPSYLVIGNQPVIFIYSWSQLITSLGSTSAVNILLADIRQACVNNGFSGAIFIGELRGNTDGAIDPNSLNQIKSCGFDYIYSYANLFTSTAQNNYTAQAKTSGIDAIASPAVGWDARYWYPQPNPGSYVATDTPSQYGGCLNWIVNSYFTQTGFNKGANSLAKSMVMLDNWSELGEGYSIIPNSLYGFGYLNAVRKEFTSASESHYDVKPEGPYNALFLNPTAY